MRALLVRGMISGSIAGLVATVVAFVLGEPGIERGIAFEEQVSAATGGAPDVELVSRGVQATVGLAAAFLIYGVAMGGLFALAYAVVHGRVGRLTRRGTAGLLALGAFLVLFVVPFVKYPPNPPGATAGGTISQRASLYLVLVLLSAVVAVTATALARRIAGRVGGWNAAILAGVGYLAVVGLIMVAMPAINETPADFPATALYDFRLASIATQATMWLILGLLFGALVERSSTPGGVGSRV
jgi:hypothetical protein